MASLWRRYIVDVADPGRVDPDEEVRQLGQLMLERDQELAASVADRCREAVPFYRQLPPDMFHRACVEHIHFLCFPLVGKPRAMPDQEEAGRQRAQAGVPLTAVMDAYRIGVLHFWDELAATAMRTGASVEATLRISSELWHGMDQVTRQLEAGYRDEIIAQTRRYEQQRSSLVQALLEGRLDDTNVWEAAEILQLPRKGPYVVVSAYVPSVGEHALPDIERELADLGIGSAWRLTHDLEIGVVCLPRPKTQLDRLITALSGHCNSRVGVSPPYLDLRSTTRSMRLARIALHGAFDAQPVVVFDNDPMAVIAASAPEVMRRMSRTALAGLDHLPPADRAILLDTLGTWLDHGGSIVRTAEVLFVHRNTVRHRLKRLEEHTGRSLTDPRWIAEVSVAFEIDRRLEPGDRDRSFEAV